jgi:hypothetical protein
MQVALHVGVLSFVGLRQAWPSFRYQQSSFVRKPWLVSRVPAFTFLKLIWLLFEVRAFNRPVVSQLRNRVLLQQGCDAFLILTFQLIFLLVLVAPRL